MWMTWLLWYVVVDMSRTKEGVTKVCGRDFAIEDVEMQNFVID